MTIAWYGHLKYKHVALVTMIAGELADRVAGVLPPGAGEPDRPRALHRDAIEGDSGSGVAVGVRGVRVLLPGRGADVAQRGRVPADHRGGGADPRRRPKENGNGEEEKPAEVEKKLVAIRYSANFCQASLIRIMVLVVGCVRRAVLSQRSSTRRMSGGRGASASIHCSVRGCRNRSRKACSACRPISTSSSLGGSSGTRSESFNCVAAAVELVGEHRAADVQQVNADLVRAAGSRLHLHQREPAEPLQHLVVAQRVLRVGVRRDDHPQPVVRVHLQRAFDVVRVAVEFARRRSPRTP